MAGAGPAPGEIEARFESLLTSLRHARYPVGPDARAAAFGILVDEIARSGSDLRRLRHRLTPLFATDQQSQTDIARRIDAFAAAGFADADLTATPVEAEGRAAAVRADRLRQGRLVIASLVAGVIALAAIWTLWPEAEAPPKPVAPATLPQPSGVPDPPTPIPPDPRVEIDPVTDITIGDPVPHPARPFVVAAAALAPVALATVWALLRRRRRRRWTLAAGRRAVEPDERLARSFGAQGIPLTDIVGETADRLGGVVDAASRDLDMRATIGATVRAAGFFTPVHARERNAADYVVLIERRAPNDHLARLVDDIFDRIEARGVSLRRLYYRDDPRRAIATGELRPAGSFEALEERFGAHRFVVVGSGEGFFHPLTGELLDWARALDALTSRTLLSARPPRRWGYREEELLGAGFSVGPASPEGLAQFARVVAKGEDAAGGRRLTSAPPTPQMAEERVSPSRLPPFATFRDEIPTAPTPLMVVLPAGEFLMGSPESEDGRSSDEGPQRIVRVGAFALGRDAVTFEEYDAFCAATGRESPDDNGWGRGRRPVTNVSWHDARAYLAWLNEQVPGAPYRLPSEAEWEYACRAGTKGPLAFGTTISTTQANYSTKFGSPDGSKSVYGQQTVPVDDLAATNDWGLRHMHGNVMEWVEDHYHDNYDDAPMDEAPWLIAGDSSSRRVVRGGSRLNEPEYLRSAFRGRVEPDDRLSYLGFRPARTLTP